MLLLKLMVANKPLSAHGCASIGDKLTSKLTHSAVEHSNLGMGEELDIGEELKPNRNATVVDATSFSGEGPPKEDSPRHLNHLPETKTNTARPSEGHSVESTLLSYAVGDGGEVTAEEDGMAGYLSVSLSRFDRTALTFPG